MTTLFAWSGSLDLLDQRKVTQCALSRVCAMCGASLGRPVAFVGVPDEIVRNAFHVPPLHATCADDLRRHAGADPGWQVVLTSGFEFVRAAREDADRRPTFVPNSLL